MTTSNKGKGRVFQERCRTVLQQLLGCHFEAEVPLAISPRGTHTFDLANAERTIVVECTAVGWTEAGSIPSAKIVQLREQSSTFATSKATRPVTSWSA